MRVLPGCVAAFALATVVSSWVSARPGSTIPPPDAVGGGYADSGLLGSYFDNPGFVGSATFTRRDVRIDFRWEGTRPVGGSRAEPYRSFPSTAFSIRWEGRIIPRFSEPYRFVGERDGSLEIRVKAPDAAEWTTLVARDPGSGAFESPPFEFTSGKLYAIEVSYVATSATPSCVVGWTSPSTPREVVDPVTQQGFNAASMAAYAWADRMKLARWGNQQETLDARGWPTESGTELILSEGDSNDSEESGAYLLSFDGRAKVRLSCCNDVAFFANEFPHGRELPKGSGYDAAKNRTTASMVASGSRTMLFFDDSVRDRDGAGGVTNVRFMRPIAPGSDRYHRLDEVVSRPFKRFLQDDFTALRWLDGANRETEADWKDRIRPGDAFFATDTQNENWEYLVMLANETGKDLSITTPVGATDDYLEKLALLLRYGSNGDEPYRAPTANPEYPPLNPNLRVYVEVGNEIWNWVFGSTGYARRLAMEEAERNTDTWRAMNHDGSLEDTGSIQSIRRWLAYRTVRASELFRGVFGDEGMGPRVRMLLSYQYDNFQETASQSLLFIDQYFGVAGPGVPEPHPVSYYLWGGGGATYYGLANQDGAQSEVVLADPSFENAKVSDDQRVMGPEGSAWTFRGRAGVVRPTGPGTISELVEVAEPIDGEQYAFLLGGGSISQQVNFTRPGEYAILFKAAGNGKEWPGYLPFDIYIDDRRVNPRGQSDIRYAKGDWELGGWSRRIDSLEEEWGSAVFEITRPGPHTVRFAGRSGSQHLLLDNIRIGSVDAILDSGFGVGVAQGQVGSPDIAYQFRTEAKYARTFGLQVVAYESGWSVGGDFHQLPIQNWAKLRAARAEKINDQAIEFWDQSGSFMQVWGVYLYFPAYDLSRAASYPIMRSIRGAAERLRAEPTYGATLPAELTRDEADWSHSFEEPSDAPWWHRYVPWLDKPGRVEWHSWMLVAPRTSRYRVIVAAEGEGTVRVDVDGTEVMVPTANATSLPAVEVNLTQGAHAIRVTTTGGARVQRVQIAP
ncbi:MAG: hypothetical protein AAF997_05395 [Myxococcota bacterium]